MESQTENIGLYSEYNKIELSLDNAYKKDLLDEFLKLVLIIKTLRSPNGCPWDRQQTHKTLKKFLLEEAKEVEEAIDNDKTFELCEELGDLLMNILMQAQIAEENSNFTIIDVLRKIKTKLINRHPHVFSEKSSNLLSSDDVVNQWKQIKETEKNSKRTLSSNMKQLLLLHSAFSSAIQLQQEASKVGFDFPSINNIIEKIKEEISELENLLQENKVLANKIINDPLHNDNSHYNDQYYENNSDCNKADNTKYTDLVNIKKCEKVSSKLSDIDTHNKIESEIGDILFSIVNICRFLKINPEHALKKANNKFVHRFQYIEEQLIKNNKDILNCSIHELDEFWNKAKSLGLE